MKTKYAMMVTIKEARKIYVARALKARRKMGFAPIIKTKCDLPKDRVKKIRDAVTLTQLQSEEIQVC